jgi:prepilin signal peptidase PulO-like enzyme (type II secretory pathway)
MRKRLQYVRAKKEYLFPPLPFPFFFILWAISKGRWIGFGDVKLAGALGLFFGFPEAPLIIYIATISGGILGAFLLSLGKAHRKTALPFGTLLALAGAVMIFFQEPILAVFKHYFSL